MVYKYLLLPTVFYTAGTENKAANRTGKIKAFMQLYALAGWAGTSKCTGGI